MPMDQDKAFHLSLKVQDLGKSVEFYGRLLGVAPAKIFADYAKFEVEDPALVLSLEPMRDGDRQGLDHLGIRLASRAALVDATSRIAERGLAFEHLAGVECCFSRQSKIYMNDPDGHLVEVYTVEADLAESRAARGADAVTGATCEARDGTFEHLLPSAFPAKIAAPDASLREINLRGTFNAAMTRDEAWRIVEECRRALQPGGKMTTHILVADREVDGELPRLPEPAAHVRRVPTEAEMRSLFEEAGFVGIELKRFSHASVFGFGGAEFREYLLVASTAQRLEPKDHVAVYKGPFPSVTDERGNTYRRGVRTDVSAEAATLLRAPTYKEHFVVLVAGGGC